MTFSGFSLKGMIIEIVRVKRRNFRRNSWSPTSFFCIKSNPTERRTNDVKIKDIFIFAQQILPVDDEPLDVLKQKLIGRKENVD